MLRSDPDRISILHTGDFHGKLTPQKAERIRAIKAEGADLYFDAGDCLRTGNLGVPILADPAWEGLAHAGCDASVIGNRETHLSAIAFEAKIKGAKHPVLCANLKTKSGELPLKAELILKVRNWRIGVVGVMVPMVTRKMSSRVASAYLWDPPAEALAASVQKIRGEVDLLIALTHIGLTQDRAIAKSVPGIDMILGGHSHDVLPEMERSGKTFIGHSGSHGRLVARYEWRMGEGVVSTDLLPLP